MRILMFMLASLTAAACHAQTSDVSPNTLRPEVEITRKPVRAGPDYGPPALRIGDDPLPVERIVEIFGFKAQRDLDDFWKRSRTNSNGRVVGGLTEDDVRRIVSEMLDERERLAKEAKEKEGKQRPVLDPRRVDAASDEQARQKRWDEYQAAEQRRIQENRLVTEQMRQNELKMLAEKKAACLEANVCPWP